MAKKSGFNGFPKECIEFYHGLTRNNSKEWFEAHRKDFDAHVMAPAREFVSEMGKKLSKIAPGIIADPRTDKSIFRLHRDTRFAKDKSPYKTHLGIFLWEGERPKMECAGFYFHLEPPKFMLGAGLYMFSKPLLAEWRESLVHKTRGPALVKALKQAGRKGYSAGGEHYKRVPRGFDPDHPRAQYLRFNGLHLGKESRIPKEFHSAKLLDLCFEHCKDLLPVHKWLVDMSRRAEK